MTIQILGKFMSCEDQQVHRFITLSPDTVKLIANKEASLYDSYQCISDEVFINYMNTIRTYADRDQIDLVLGRLYTN